MKRWTLVWMLVMLCGTTMTFAQESGAGKVEVGFFPGGAMFFVGGDGDREANFNNFTSGGFASWNLSRLLGLEAEGSFGLGISQDVTYGHQSVRYIPVPALRSFGANAVVFPQGSNRKFVPYLTGGAGLLRITDRETTAQFGLTSPENFVASNFGGGLRMYRSGTGLQGWGGRVDYRLFSIGKKDDAAAFFAKSKRRMGHRVYVGFMYTLKR